MMLLQACGLLNVELAEDDDQYSEVLELLVHEAEMFQLAGGQLSLGDWRCLEPIEKAAFAAAGERLMTDLAVRTGTAAQGPDQAAAMLEPHDGGAAKTKLDLARMVAKAASTAPEQEPVQNNRQG